MMKWEDVRKAFPDQFVLVSILDYHYEEGKKVVDEVAPIRVIEEKDANKAFFSAEEGTMVYHTQNEKFVIHQRKDPLMKVRRI